MFETAFIALVVAALYDFLKDPPAFKAVWGAKMRRVKE